jgi:hypothetical protein
MVGSRVGVKKLQFGRRAWKDAYTIYMRTNEDRVVYPMVTFFVYGSLLPCVEPHSDVARPLPPHPSPSPSPHVLNFFPSSMEAVC